MKRLLVLAALLGVFGFGIAAIGSKPSGVTGECGGEYSGGQGVFASPNFPVGKYPPLSTCDYTVTVPKDKVIKFEFIFMDMEDGPVQKLSHCLADYLAITESNTEEGAMVGKQTYCGHETPFNPVFTKSNQAYVWFRTDDSVQMDGFALKWSAVEPQEEQFDCNFDTQGGLCEGWEQLEKTGRAKWIIIHGKTHSSKREWVTGPPFDHTTGTIVGKYAYAEATLMRTDSVVSLVTAPATIMKTEKYCLSFWYHMFGSGIGKLSVYEVQDSKQEPPRRGNIIFEEEGNKGKSWQEGQITINRRPTPTRFIFEAKRGPNFRGDIAIDDITITENKCSGIK